MVALRTSATHPLRVDWLRTPGPERLVHHYRVARLVSLVQDRDRVADLARLDRRTVIHCIGGLGRTGTVAGCVLAALGQSPDAALAELAEVRSPNCPENDRQRAFIRAWARRQETGR